MDFPDPEDLMNLPEDFWDAIFNETVFESLQRDLQTAISELDRWKTNEVKKERDYSKVDKDLREDHLNSVQKRFETICCRLHEIPLEEQATILNNMVPNLIVLIRQPSTNTEGRVITKKMHVRVRLLLGKEYCASVGKVVAQLFNHNDRPVLLTKNNTQFILDGNTSEFSRCSEEINIWQADFSPSFEEPPKRLVEANSSNVRSVCDESFWVKFELTLNFVVGHYDEANKTDERILRSFTASATSFPLKIVVNMSQYADAWETLIWDNAAGNFGIQHISTRPLQLPYQDVVQAMNTRFSEITGRSLETEDFKAIVKKLIGLDFFERIQPTTERHISLGDFQKETKIEYSVKTKNVMETITEQVSLCSWFYMAGKFIRDCLEFDGNKKRNNKGEGIRNSLWIDRKVMGYIPYRDAYVMLNTCSIGTFLIRLSTATPKAITVDFKHEQEGGNSGIRVSSLRVSIEELKAISLPERIMQNPGLKFLYSRRFAEVNISKDTVFVKSNTNVHQYESPYDPQNRRAELERAPGDFPTWYVEANLEFVLKF